MTTPPPSSLSAWRRLRTHFGPYLRREAPVLAAVLGLSGLSALLGLFPPIVARQLIDHVFLGGHQEQLLTWLGVGFALSVAAMTIGGANRWLYTRTTTLVLARVRQDLLSHLLSLPLPFLVGQRTGDLVSRLNNDVAEVQRTLTDSSLQLLLGLLSIVGAASWLLWLDWRLALASFAVAPVLLGVLWAVRPRTLAIARELRGLTGEIMAFLTEILQGAPYVQANDLGPVVTQRYGDWNQRFYDAVMRQQLWSGLAGALPSLAMGLNAVIILGYGGYRIGQHQQTVGGLLAFAAYQWRFFGPLRGFVGLGLRLQQAQAALERIEVLWRLQPLPEAPNLPVPSPTAPVAVALHDLHFAYQADVPVLQGVTGEIPAGRVTALVGANGTGKTTLLQLLLKLQLPAQGAIRINGDDLAHLDGHAWRRRVALVAQDGVFFHASLAENLRLAAPTADDAALRDVLAAVGLLEAVLAWPQGLDTIIGDRGLRLSGGQRQRLSLARALLKNADLLILDEATSALDMLTEAAVWENVRAWHGERTVLLITHRAAMARRADHLLILDGGRIVAEGPPAVCMDGETWQALAPGWAR